MNFRKLALSLVCLVGLSGCSTGKLDSEGQQFVSGVIEQQKTQWDAHKIAASMDPASGASEEDIAQAFEKYTDVVGSLKSVGAITRTNFQSSIGVNVPDYKGQYSAELSCSKAPANWLMNIEHRNGQWHILSFDLTSDAFKGIDHKERAGAQEFLDGISKQICNDWKIEVLSENADPEFAEVLKKQSLGMKATFLASAKTLGTLKKFKKAHFKTEQAHQGKTLYNYVAKERFEHGRVSLKYVVGKSEGKWKLFGFFLQANEGD